MTSIYDPSTGTGARSATGHANPATWPGPGYPGGPFGPPGYGSPGGRRPRRPLRRLRRRFVIAVYIVVVALASYWGLQNSHSQSGAGGHQALPSGTIASRVDPGLVDIVSTLGYQHAAAAGTGMVISSSGDVLTNNHVIEGATSIRVTDIGDGHTYRAVVLGYDRSHDIALLHLRGASGLTTVRTGNSAAARVGQQVVGIGNAGGRGGTPSVVAGRIIQLGAQVTARDSAARTEERLTGLIGHNAPIRPGDSGGPLVDRAARVIGINTAASSGHGGFQLESKTHAFAIPINQALSIARRIETGSASGTVHIGATGFIGVAVESVTQAAAGGVPAGHGVGIASVFSGSPASQAGLAAGDVIVSADGRRVGSPLALQSALGRHHPGDRVTITWIGLDGLRHSATVTLISGPAG